MSGVINRIRKFAGILGVLALLSASLFTAQDVAAQGQDAPGSGALIKLDNEIGVQLYLGGGPSRSQSFSGTIKGATVPPAPVFGNTGTDHDRSNMVDLTFGAATQVGAVLLRGEIEYTAQRSFDLTTNGFPGGRGAPPFFYRSKIENRTTFANVWVDYALQNLFEGAGGLYVTAGGGVGTSHTDLRVIDFPLGIGGPATNGSGNQTASAWMLGLGVGYAVTDWMMVDLGVRRVDLGRIDVGLQSVVGAVPTGSFGVDMESDEAFARIRVNFLGL